MEIEVQQYEGKAIISQAVPISNISFDGNQALADQCPRREELSTMPHHWMRPDTVPPQNDIDIQRLTTLCRENIDGQCKTAKIECPFNGLPGEVLGAIRSQINLGLFRLETGQKRDIKLPISVYAIQPPKK